MSNSLTTAIKISINAPIFPASAVTSLIWCSPENIVSGRNVPEIPSRIPPAVARRIVNPVHLLLIDEVSFLNAKYKYPARIPISESGIA